ncbi:cytochrome c-type biogenesis protein [Marinobacterium sediminicola]|uniref:Cytochrome c-type biogenesis protein n=1 Tax=Marinobacterium sediminicola TaxID=518898 RepID=A0ABY1RYP6_9GAMM|nr:cytochrome c-type biogenesis protein [Marinobacterium sediminicola]ULG68739.1 cytochrome c-type biogenesis protein CcmH [Marinobacterium sediminicola]SMR73265.1 cytochrome c-type biogenesis protein CcmH [Marinobacterium sediminicola]
MKALLLSLMLLLPFSAQAAIDAYEFSDEQKEARFQQLTGELRCPKCQNQNIADSDAPLASDLRREVHRMLEEGESDEGIIDFMVTRYGDFVLYRPRVNETTWLLWYGPFVLLGIGVLVVVLISRNRRQSTPTGPKASSEVGGQYQASEGLTTEEAERLNKLLQRDSDQ